MTPAWTSGAALIRKQFRFRDCSDAERWLTRRLDAMSSVELLAELHRLGQHRLGLPRHPPAMYTYTAVRRIVGLGGFAPGSERPFGRRWRCLHASSSAVSYCRREHQFAAVRWLRGSGEELCTCVPGRKSITDFGDLVAALLKLVDRCLCNSSTIPR
jgi:hypothetical protein